MIELIISSRNTGKNYDVAPLLDGDLTYTTERIGAASKITFDIIKNGEIVFHEGDPVRCIIDGYPLFSAFIRKKK